MTENNKERRGWKRQKIWTDFALEYAVNSVRHPLNYWAKKYNVSMRTIERWLEREDVQKIITEQKKKIEEHIQEAIKQYSVDALQELYTIMKMKRKNETKRKACNDILGLARIENVNIEGKTNVNVSNIDYSKLTNEQLSELYQRKLNREKQDS